MKKSIRIIIISLTALMLIGAILLYPPVRFSLLLRLERFSDAEAVYLSRMSGSDRMSEEAENRLRSYVDKQLKRYYANELTYERTVAGILRPLSQTKLPQTDIARCLSAAEDMEAARTSLAQADAAFAAGDYARAVPLYRQALLADESVAQRLEQAENNYREQTLEKAKAAMDAGQFADAERALLDGMIVLGEDDPDLAAALLDARRMAADAAYDAAKSEARRLLNEEGPKAAIRYLEGLRAMQPQEYALEYLEQELMHEYEEDVCTKARSLRDAGDLTGACSLLEEGLLWIDSPKMMLLLAEIRGDILYLLGEMPVLWDNTASARTHEESTVRRDVILTDALGNQYDHSFSADAGSISYDLGGNYALFIGTVAFPGGEKTDIYRSSATLQIYGDGKLLAEFKNVDRSSAPIDFSLPVFGVRELKLCWISEGANGWKDWGRFATIFDGRFMTAKPAEGKDH